MRPASDEAPTQCPPADVLDAYVGRRLSDEDVTAFERHYFSCEICWREVGVQLPEDG